MRMHEPALRQFPFLPPDFLDQVGYRDRFDVVGLFWDGSGDELALYVPGWSGAGLHNNYAWLAVMRQPRVWAWLSEHMIHFGSSDRPETHHLVVVRDSDGCTGYTVPSGMARAVVARQRLDPGDFFEEDPTA